MPVLYRINNLTFSYGNTKALQSISLDIGTKEITCFTGPSGSGKSTFLSLLSLIESVQEGEIFFCGQSLKALSEQEKNTLRRHHLGLIFQRFHLFPVLTAEENVAYFLEKQGISHTERRRRTESALETVGLSEHRSKRPWEMSGGQRQRVAIARALAKHPKVILADEPTSSLDQDTGREIMDLLCRLHQEQAVAIVIASHDVMVHEYATRLVMLRDGMLSGSRP